MSYENYYTKPNRLEIRLFKEGYFKISEPTRVDPALIHTTEKFADMIYVLDSLNTKISKDGLRRKIKLITLVQLMDYLNHPNREKYKKLRKISYYKKIKARQKRE
jgi:hypothetical protein